MIALLAAWTCGSGCAAGTGAHEEKSSARRHETSDERDAREAREPKPQITLIKPQAVTQSQSGQVTVQAPLPEKPVREGTSPIIYLLPAAGSIRIVDKTTQSDIAKASAEARAIIRIDDLTGVSIGKQTLLPGPLPAGHEYAIYLSSDVGNDVTRSVTGPAR